MEAKRSHAGRLFGIVAVVLAMAGLILAIAAWPHAAFAEGDESSSAAPASESSAAPSESSDSAASEPPVDEARKALEASGDPTDPNSPPVFGGVPLMGNDYVWFGRGLTLQAHAVANDLIAAGQTVSLMDMKAGGSFRVAAQDITIENSVVAENITVAAERVVIKNSEANSIAAAGRTASVSGSCKELTIYADKAYIDGVVEGDVVVAALPWR